jgi:hypothetical protein
MLFDHVINIPPMGDDTMRQMANKITPDATMAANLVYIAEGNIGAMTVIEQMFKVDEDRAAYTLGLCTAWHITGSMLWLLYKDVNNKDVTAMMEMILKEGAQDALQALPYGGYRKDKKW